MPLPMSNRVKTIKFASLNCYACQISLCHAKIEKNIQNFFVMINKDGGGQFLDFVGETQLYEGGTYSSWLVPH